MLASPRYQEHQPNAGADGAVGHVEGREADLVTASLVQVKANEVNDAVARGQQAVGEVPGDATKDQAKGDLAQERARVKMMPAQEENEQRGQRDDGEQLVVAAEQTPRGAGVAPMHELEKTINDHPFLSAAEPPEHEEFCELIEGKDCERDARDAAVRRAQ